jgi:ABC-type nitrate/sulfonate/bicarbonate transport system permease component
MLVGIWELISISKTVPGYMLPAPTKVVLAFVEDFSLLMEHLKVTLFEAALGLVFGILLGVITAILVDNFTLIRKGIYPLIIISQTIPTVAIAPLLVLWFGYGILPKIILIILVTFFPIAIGLIGGFSAVDKDMIILMKSMGANKLEIFYHVKFPAALGEFFSGLKIAVAYSVVGAVISEWLGGFSGLGVYMTRVKKSYSYDKMFAVILLISGISLLLMWITKLVQKRCMPWEKEKE